MTAAGPPLTVLLLGFYTPLHAGLVVTLLTAPWTLGAPPGAALAGALGLLYLFPPVAARVLLRLGGAPASPVSWDSPAFVRWWALCQLQLIFNRLPFLEETLRLVPGLYSAWLRLWGARVGRYVFWAPGVVVTDRSFLDVGDRVCIGLGTKLLGHLFRPEAGPGRDLVTAPIRIGAGAVVGGLSILGPGTCVGAGEAPPACTVLAPYWAWEGGRRVPADRDVRESDDATWPAAHRTRGCAC